LEADLGAILGGEEMILLYFFVVGILILLWVAIGAKVLTAFFPPPPDTMPMILPCLFWPFALILMGVVDILLWVIDISIGREVKK